MSIWLLSVPEHPRAGLDSISDFYTGPSSHINGATQQQGPPPGIATSFGTVMRQNSFHRQYHRRNESSNAPPYGTVGQTIADEDQSPSINEVNMRPASGEDNNSTLDEGNNSRSQSNNHGISPKQRKSQKSTTSGGPFFYSLVRNLFTGSKQSKHTKSLRKESVSKMGVGWC